jgi:hypothetical protein
VADNIGSMCMFSMLMALGVEIPIYASRLFREEIRWQTWSNLYLLPVSVTKLSIDKILGTLPTFLPGLIIFIFGAILAPGVVDDFFEEALDEVGFWWFISQYILGVHVVVLLSLIVKWGALPLGIAVVVMGNVLFVTCASQSGTVEEILIVPIFFAIVGTCVSIAPIGDRLRALASR